MIIYADGSEQLGSAVSHNGQTIAALDRVYGYGVVALCDDSHVELSGRYVIPQRANVRKGQHENIAMIEAVHYAIAHGKTPREVVFYTDDEFWGYCGCSLRNRMSASFESNFTHLKALYRYLYGATDERYDELLVWMKESRFVKVKGHSDCVYNNRVDILANTACNGRKAASPFETWLKKGRQVWNHERQETERRPFPFVDFLLGVDYHDNTA